MELLRIECLGKPLLLEGSLAGWQQLYWDQQLVAQKAAGQDNEGLTRHRFSLQQLQDDGTEPHIIEVELEANLRWEPFSLSYQLKVQGEVVAQGSRTEKDIERQEPMLPRDTGRKLGVIGLVSLGLKLLKSAKMIKVVLAGASLAAYSWLFSFQFAVALIACLVVHEYGHVRAMQYFGMKTKGFYLIPFLGGMALTDEKINTRWQDVVISIMGPVFGLGMSLLCLLAWWLTDNPIFAGLAGFNALLNLFNLLPIVPLDGGHVIKSISFSMNSHTGLAMCVGGIGLGVVISYSFGLTLLALFLLIGSVEIFAEWRGRHQSHLLPLNRYGQIFSAVWYLCTLAAFVAIIVYLGGQGDSIFGLPLEILKS